MCGIDCGCCLTSAQAETWEQDQIRLTCADWNGSILELAFVLWTKFASDTILIMSKTNKHTWPAGKRWPLSSQKMILVFKISKLFLICIQILDILIKLLSSKFLRKFRFVSRTFCDTNFFKKSRICMRIKNSLATMKIRVIGPSFILMRNSWKIRISFTRPYDVFFRKDEMWRSRACWNLRLRPGCSGSFLNSMPRNDPAEYKIDTTGNFF